MVRLYHLERVSFRDGVNEEEALAVEHIVLPHRTVSYIPPLSKGRQLPQNKADRRTKSGQRSGVTSQLTCRGSKTITDPFPKKKIDVPKLFLASCVQHVYEGLLPVDITFLPV